MYTCNPSTYKVETGESVIQGHFQLHYKFNASLGYKKQQQQKKKQQQQQKSNSLNVHHNRRVVKWNETLSIMKQFVTA